MHIVLLKCPDIQIAFLKFTSRDNQTLVGCIPIAAVAVRLKPEIIKNGQSSHMMYSNNIVNFQESTTTLNAYTKKKKKKSLETYWMHHVTKGLENTLGELAINDRIETVQTTALLRSAGIFWNVWGDLLSLRPQ